MTKKVSKREIEMDIRYSQGKIKIAQMKRSLLSLEYFSAVNGNIIQLMRNRQEERDILKNLDQVNKREDEDDSSEKIKEYLNQKLLNVRECIAKKKAFLDRMKHENHVRNEERKRRLKTTGRTYHLTYNDRAFPAPRVNPLKEEDDLDRIIASETWRKECLEKELNDHEK